jgi:hypothetical protein
MTYLVEAAQKANSHVFMETFHILSLFISIPNLHPTKYPLCTVLPKTKF